MLKSLYSPAFVGSACSNFEHEPGALALLPHFPSFGFEICGHRENIVSLRTDGDHPPLSTFPVIHKSGLYGDRFCVEDQNYQNFARSGVVVGSAVSFNFHGTGISGQKEIEPGVVYFVQVVDLLSSPPFFSVTSRSGTTTIALKELRCATAGTKATVTIYFLAEGTPVSFECGLNLKSDSPKVLEAGSVVYATEIEVAPEKSILSFRVGGCEPFMNCGPGRRQLRLHIVDKAIYVARWPCGKKTIVRRAGLRHHPVLQSWPEIFVEQKERRSATSEMLQLISGADSLDLQLLVSLGSFASACRLLDQTDRFDQSNCSKFQQQNQRIQESLLQASARHLEKFLPSFERDCGSVELVEYAAFRLLQLNAVLNASQDRKHDSLRAYRDSVAERIQSAWNVLNLYGATVAFDRHDDHIGIQQSCSAFCVSGNVFVLVRNGFIVIGHSENGECISLKLPYLHSSGNDRSTKAAPSSSSPSSSSSSSSSSAAAAATYPFSPTSGLRPCVVDAKFVEGSLYLMILHTLPSELKDFHVYAGIFKIEKSFFDACQLSVKTVHTANLQRIGQFNLRVGNRIPFNVFVPKFVVKPPSWTKTLHVFTGVPRPSIRSISLQDDHCHEWELDFPRDAKMFDYLCSVIVPSKSPEYQDFWVLVRVKVLSEKGQTQEVKLFRFGMSKSNKQTVLIAECSIETDEAELLAPVDLWQLCLTNHKLGVGVASPKGHFYRVCNIDEVAKKVATKRLESPFSEIKRVPAQIIGESDTGFAKYVPWQKLGPVAEPDGKKTDEIMKLAGQGQGSFDQVIEETLSLMPHFLAFRLCSVDYAVDDAKRITLPFCPTRNVNVTRLLLSSLEGIFEGEDFVDLSREAMAEEAQKNIDKELEAHKEYLALMQVKPK